MHSKELLAGSGDRRASISPRQPGKEVARYPSARACGWVTLKADPAMK